MVLLMADLLRERDYFEVAKAQEQGVAETWSSSWRCSASSKRIESDQIGLHFNHQICATARRVDESSVFRSNLAVPRYCWYGYIP